MNHFDAAEIVKIYRQYDLSISETSLYVKSAIAWIQNMNDDDAEQAIHDFAAADLREIEGDNAEAAAFEMNR